MAEFELPENDFRLVLISNTNIDTLTGIRNNGILRNLDSTNSVAIATESAGSDTAAILADATTARNHKLVLQAGQEAPVRNFRKLFATAFGANVLLQWIPLRTVNS